MSQNSNSSNQQQAGETPGASGLKAERIQEALAAAASPRLKAERIQLALRDLPGWTLQRGGIARTFDLADSRETSRMLQYVAELGFDGDMPEVHVRRGKVTFVLPTVDQGWLEEPLFEMAKSLGTEA
jgi:pterin-4a-carbinolamine dehydratase